MRLFEFKCAFFFELVFPPTVLLSCFLPDPESRNKKPLFLENESLSLWDTGLLSRTSRKALNKPDQKFKVSMTIGSFKSSNNFYAKGSYCSCNWKHFLPSEVDLGASFVHFLKWGMVFQCRVVCQDSINGSTRYLGHSWWKQNVGFYLMLKIS